MAASFADRVEHHQSRLAGPRQPRRWRTPGSVQAQSTNDVMAGLVLAIHEENPWIPGSSPGMTIGRSEEHTSELQSQSNLVCRLLLAKTRSAGAGGARLAQQRSQTLRYQLPRQSTPRP